MGGKRLEIYIFNIPIRRLNTIKNKNSLFHLYSLTILNISKATNEILSIHLNGLAKYPSVCFFFYKNKENFVDINVNLKHLLYIHKLKLQKLELE